MSRLKVFLITVAAGVTAGLVAAAGFWAGDHINTAGRFSEPLHSVFIAECIGIGVPQDLCFCAEQKIYHLEDSVQAGGNISGAFMDAVSKCAEENPVDLD